MTAVLSLMVIVLCPNQIKKSKLLLKSAVFDLDDVYFKYDLTVYCTGRAKVLPFVYGQAKQSLLTWVLTNERACFQTMCKIFYLKEIHMDIIFFLI